jgi:hypothetical protein
MSTARIYLLVAAFVALAVTGIAAAPAHSRSAPAAANHESCPAERATAAAPADLLGGIAPQPNTVCKPGTGCCTWITPHICGLCSASCSSPVAGDDA